MPQSNAERKRKFIASLKEKGAYENYKKQRADKAKERRERKKKSLLKLTEAKRNQFLNEERIKCRKRVEKHRQNKKNHESPKKMLQTSSYRTKSALRKATTKTRKTLPLSSGKRNEILHRIVHSLGATDQEEIFCKKPVTKYSNGKGLAPELITAVRKFYEDDEITCMSPNVKDCRFFKNPLTGEKEITQIRHMLYKLKEAYHLFLIDYAAQSGIETFETNDPPLKLTKFCALRPKHVKLVNNMPHDVCCCIYHENFIECCSILNKNLPGFPSYGPESTLLLTCDPPTRACWFKTCEHCLPTEVDKRLSDLLKVSNKSNKKVKWLQWVKDEKENRLQRLTVNQNVKKLVTYFTEIYPQFSKHSFIKRAQAESFKLDRESVESKTNECIIHVDFPENFTCEAQSEVQGAHWNQFQISLFTVAQYLGKSFVPKVLVSDNADHSKNTIVAYLYTLFLRIPKTIKVVKLWSDGPVSQFKNKFIAAIMVLFEKLFPVKIVWNYFATAHGKGAVDGIGAVAKRKVKRLIMSRKAIVNSAKEFVHAFNMEKSLVEVFEMTHEAIDKINKKLRLEDVFNNAQSVTAIASCHQLQVIGNKIVAFVISSDGYEHFKK